MHKEIDNEEVNKLCEQYLGMLDVKTATDETLKNIREKLNALSDGRDSITTSKFHANIKRIERWAWDQKKLETLKKDNSEVETTYKVDRKRFDAMPPEKRRAFREALTVHLNRVDVKIERVLEDS